MRKTIVSVFAAAAVFGLAGATPAFAAQGVNEVVVFSDELTPLQVYENPTGCVQLPTTATQLNNQTDQVVTLYGDPFCMTPGITVQPGHGARLAPGTGAFAAGLQCPP
jgi:hypothetical protein